MNIAEYLSEDNLAKVDMEPFYQVLVRTEAGSGNFKPSVLLNIFKELPDGKKVLHGRNACGYDQVFLRADTPQNMLCRVLAELGKIGSKRLPIGGFISSNAVESSLSKAQSFCLYDGKDIARLQSYCLSISKILKILCPQIIFVPDYPSSGTIVTDNVGDTKAVLLKQNNNNISDVFFLVHELRHAWQKEYHPEVFYNYTSLADVQNKYGSAYRQWYNSQIAEFDAEVFACAAMKHLFFDDSAGKKSFCVGNTDVHQAIKRAADHFFPTGVDFLTGARTLPNYQSVYPDLIA